MRLMDAALSCLADYGYQGTTVRRIAERADVTAGLVRHHFDGKDTLLVETYRHFNGIALARMAASLAENHDGLDPALNGAINALFPDTLRNVRQMRIMVAFWGLVLTDARIAEIQHQTNAAFHTHLVAMIEAYSDFGTDAADIAEGIMAIADGLWLECCMNPDRMSPEKAIEIALRFARASLGIESSKGSG